MSPYLRIGYRITAAIVLFAALLPACATLPDTKDSNSAIYTAGASTLLARLTLEAEATPLIPAVTPPPKQVRTPSPTAPPPPSEAPVVTEPPIVLPSATLTPPPASPTPPPAPCNRLNILGDVNLPPDSTIQAGTAVTKVWRVQNSGSCSWTPGYALIYARGNLIPANSVQPKDFGLPGTIPPGGVADLAVTFTAPALPGIYQGEWMLRSDTGEIFGGGETGSTTLYTRVQVYQPQENRDIVYDVGSNYCFGEWRSAEGRLPCPGSPESREGSVLFVESPRLESRSSGGYILWTRPNRAADGWIQGRTESILIHTNDHFFSEIGCLSGNPDCDVIFELGYSTANGAAERLGRWRETYDGSSGNVDVDLSFLAGRRISLLLTVYNRGRPADADAFWLQPQVRPAAAEPESLVWTREGVPFSNSCQELRVFRTGTTSAVAVASDCEDGSIELGRVSLSTNQLAQLRRWEQRLADFDGEMYAATGGRPIISWIYFRGYGTGVATEPEMRSLANFAEQLFNEIDR